MEAGHVTVIAFMLRTRAKKLRICVVTAGQLSTCPRMVKAADALADDGYAVTLVSSNGWADWAAEADRELYATRNGRWRWVCVNWDQRSASTTRFRSRIRSKLAKELVNRFGAKRLPLRILGDAHIRINRELLAATVRQECDFIYGGGSALVATAAAAAKSNTPFGLDLEDFHSAEEVGQIGTVEEIERRLLQRSVFLTAGSAAIAKGYRAKYKLRVEPINNTFSLRLLAPSPQVTREPLKIYWFSQTIGRGRGLEEAVRALGLADISAQLYLRGRPASGYVSDLSSLAQTVAPKLALLVLPPAAPDRMVELAQGYDVGLSLEQHWPLNRELCLTNKAFIYILAGLAVVFTNTAGQRHLASELREGAYIYEQGDVASLAAALRRWADDRNRLQRAKETSWLAAQRRWHWEHHEERGRLLSIIRNAIAERS